MSDVNPASMAQAGIESDQTGLVQAGTGDLKVPAVKFCGERTLDGRVCKQVVGVNNSSGKCIWHDPDRAEEAAAVRQKGAEQANSREPGPDDVPPPAGPGTLQEVILWHTWTAGALARGQIDRAVAGGLTYCLQQLRAALATRDLEKEVEELRAQVKALRDRRVT